jgi:hypothetical protein
MAANRIFQRITSHDGGFIGALCKKNQHAFTAGRSALQGKGGTGTSAPVGAIEINYPFFHDFFNLFFVDLAACHLAHCLAGIVQLRRITVESLFSLRLIPSPDQENEENKQEQKKGNHAIAPSHKGGNLSGKSQ